MLARISDKQTHSTDTTSDRCVQSVIDTLVIRLSFSCPPFYLSQSNTQIVNQPASQPVNQLQQPETTRPAPHLAIPPVSEPSQPKRWKDSGRIAIKAQDPAFSPLNQRQSRTHWDQVPEPTSSTPGSGLLEVQERSSHLSSISESSTSKYKQAETVQVCTAAWVD